jgi:hypothetical protein
MVVTCEVTYRGAVLLHGVGHLVVLVLAASTSKEALLTHVKIEALQAPVSKKIDCRKTIKLLCVKGIVSRDLHTCFWYQSADLTLLPLMERGHLLLKFRVRVEFFNFRISA